MKIKTIAASAVLASALTLTGCAAMDSIVNARARDPQGVELFVDNITHERTTAAKDALGNYNEPAFDPIPSAGVSSLAGLFNLIPGGWGGVASVSLPLLAALYWKFRQKKIASAAAAAALKVVKAKFAEIKKDWEADVLDKDGDGHVTLEEAAKYIADKGMSWLKPAALQEMLGIFASDLLTEEQKESALELLASKL